MNGCQSLEVSILFPVVNFKTHYIAEIFTLQSVRFQNGVCLLAISLDKKHLERMDTEVLELTSIFSLQFSLRYYQSRQWPTVIPFIKNASIVNRVEKRS